MSPTLYTLDASPPCRAVYMAAKAIEVDLRHKTIDVVKHEQLEPSYIKLNPKHTVPALVDEEVVLVDSHAITTYLTSMYGKSDDFYPKDIKKRARVDQMLHFDSSVAFPSLLNIAMPIRLKLTKDIPQDKVIKAQECYSFLEKFLEGQEWIALDHPTLADIHLIATITSNSFFVPYDDHPNIIAWVERCKKQDFYSENIKGLEEFSNLFGSLLNA